MSSEIVESMENFFSQEGIENNQILANESFEIFNDYQVTALLSTITPPQNCEQVKIEGLTYNVFEQ